MYKVQRIKIFDMNNPNCKLMNAPTADMFSGKPILIKENDEEKVIGAIIDTKSIQQIENEFYCDVVFFKNWDKAVEFYNYEISVDSMFRNDENELEVTFNEVTSITVKVVG